MNGKHFVIVMQILKLIPSLLLPGDTKSTEPSIIIKSVLTTMQQ